MTKFCKFFALSLEFQKFYLITRTIFSHSRSEKFGIQNTISEKVKKELEICVNVQRQKVNVSYALIGREAMGVVPLPLTFCHLILCIKSLVVIYL